MKKLPIALVLAAITAGSAHAVDINYSIEDFSAGTPNYTINGVNAGTTSDSWLKLQFPLVDINPADAVAGTGYDSGSSSRNGVVANAEPTHFVPGGTIPTGQHGFVAVSTNRNFTSNYPLTLVSNSEASLDISLSSMFFALSTDGNPVTAKGSAIVQYSALGDFTDTVQLVSFGIGQTGSWVVTPDFPMTEKNWDSTISVTITDGMAANSFTSQALGYDTASTVVFTDTAKIRINRVPLVSLVSPDTTLNHVTFLDDIVVTGGTSATVYNAEDFSAGTPNYTINGVNAGTTSDSWLKLQFPPVDINPADAVAGTDYDSGSSSRNGVVANAEPTHFVPGGTIPTGQHGFVAVSTNRNFTSNYPLTLVTDNVGSLDISLSSMFFALSTDGNPVTAKGSAIVQYSALGDFTDTVQLVSFGIGQTGSWVVTPDFPMVEHTWDSTISVTITDGMAANSFTSQALGYTTASTVVFTDTAKIRINRVPLVGLVSPDTTLNHVTFLDDIVVTGVPGPADPYAAWAMTGTLGPVTFDGDTNGDGVKDGLAFLLGVANPDDDANGALPIVTEDGLGGLVLTFSCLNDASNGDATLNVEHSSDLGITDAWTAVAVPEVNDGPTSNVTFVVTGGSPLNSVVATIDSGAAASGKVFGRLRGENP